MFNDVFFREDWQVHSCLLLKREMQAARVSARLLHKGNQDNSSEPLREKII